MRPLILNDIDYVVELSNNAEFGLQTMKVLCEYIFLIGCITDSQHVQEIVFYVS